MNKTKIRHTEITIETHSLTIIRAKGKTLSTYCERCEKTVAAFAPEQIAAFLRLDLEEVCRRIESGELHLAATLRGVALVCGGSLNSL